MRVSGPLGSKIHGHSQQLERWTSFPIFRSLRIIMAMVQLMISETVERKHSRGENEMHDQK